MNELYRLRSLLTSIWIYGPTIPWEQMPHENFDQFVAAFEKWVSAK